jgi:hypothetical protein
MKKNSDYFLKVISLSLIQVVNLLIKCSLKPVRSLLRRVKILQDKQSVERITAKLLKDIDKAVEYEFKTLFYPKNKNYDDFNTKYLHDSQINNVLREADLFIDFKSYIFSSQQLDLGKKINWQKDYIHNYDWIVDSNDIEKRKKADIKFPWELSRFHGLLYLSLAFAITKKKNYFAAYTNNLESWIEQNEYPKGVNWKCAMEVAIRATNLLVSLELFNGFQKVNPDFKERIAKLSALHAYFIKNNLEYNELVPSNHYLSDISGLLFISNYFKNAEYFKKTEIFALREIKKEIVKQVYDDGTNQEASTCYHRLVLELLFYPEKLVSGNEENIFIEKGEKYFGKNYCIRVSKMFDSVLYLLKPNGEMPQIGDNDSGQFIKLYPRKVLDMRYLLSLGAVFYNNPEWKIKEFFLEEEDIAEPLILFGEEGKKKWDSMSWSSINDIGSHAFSDSGWYVMRNGMNYCVVSCGPNGQNDFGGHAHNDKLSFELFLDGKEIIVDPGTYVYTPEPEMRNLFRSTQYHNTVMIDGEEQNRFIDNELFVMRNDAKAKCSKWEIGDTKDIFIGEHYGYTRLKNPVIHNRKINFDKINGEIEITDIFSGKGEHDLEWNFILFPGISEKIRIISGDIQVQKKHCFYSPEYGVKVDTEKICFKLKKKMPYELYVTIDKNLNFKIKEL